MWRSVNGFVHGNLNANNCRYDQRNHFSVIIGLKLIASHSSDWVCAHTCKHYLAPSLSVLHYMHHSRLLRCAVIFSLSCTEHGPEKVSKAAASRKMTLISSGPSCHINTECLLNEQSYSNQNTDQFCREQAATLYLEKQAAYNYSRKMTMRDCKYCFSYSISCFSYMVIAVVL